MYSSTKIVRCLLDMLVAQGYTKNRLPPLKILEIKTVDRETAKQLGAPSSDEEAQPLFGDCEQLFAIRFEAHDPKQDRNTANKV